CWSPPPTGRERRLHPVRRRRRRPRCRRPPSSASWPATTATSGASSTGTAPSSRPSPSPASRSAGSRAPSPCFRTATGRPGPASTSARGRLVSALVAELDRHHWDGVVLDLERLPDAARAQYPKLVSDLGRAAGDRPVIVAVPAQDPDGLPGPDGYDLGALGAA